MAPAASAGCARPAGAETGCRALPARRALLPRGPPDRGATLAHDARAGARFGPTADAALVRHRTLCRQVPCARSSTRGSERKQHRAGPRTRGLSARFRPGADRGARRLGGRRAGATRALARQGDASAARGQIRTGAVAAAARRLPPSLIGPAVYTLYVLLTRLALPFALAADAWQALRNPGQRGRVAQRLGFVPANPRPGCLWVHAVSVGEVQAAAALLNALRVR